MKCEKALPTAGLFLMRKKSPAGLVICFQICYNKKERALIYSPVLQNVQSTFCTGALCGAVCRETIKDG